MITIPLLHLALPLVTALNFVSWAPVLSSFPHSPFYTLSIDISFKLTTVRRVLYDRGVMGRNAAGIAVKIPTNYKDNFA